MGRDAFLYKSSPTPIDTKPKLSATSSAPYAYPSHHHSLAGVLQYLTFTRLNISYVVQQVCLYNMIPGIHICTLLRVLYDISGVLCIMVCFHTPPLFLHLSPMLRLIEVDIPVIVYFLVIIRFHGRPNINLLSPGLVPMSSIMGGGGNVVSKS